MSAKQSKPVQGSGSGGPARTAKPLASVKSVGRPSDGVKQTTSRPAAKPANTDTTEVPDTSTVTIATTGALGTHLEFDGLLWKVAYAGPVYFSDFDHLGLIACTDHKGARVGPPGDCNGTVDGVAYFVCEDGRGRLVPRSVVLADQSQSVKQPPSSHGVDGPDEDSMERSLSGLVVGPQSLRRLRDELPPPASLSPSPQQCRSIATQSCVPNNSTVVSVGTETDPFLLSDVSMVPVPQLYTEGSLPVDELRRVVSSMFTPLREASTRLQQQIHPLLNEEREWLEATKHRATSLEESFSWEEILNANRPASDVCRRVTMINEARHDANGEYCVEGGGRTLPRVEAGSRLASFVAHQVATMEGARNRRSTMPHHVDAIEAVLCSARSGTAAESMEALASALKPFMEYANMPTTCIQLVASQEHGHATATGDSKFVARVDEQQHLHEQLKRLEFSLSAASNDATVAASEGRIEALEAIGHSKVDLAQTMQQVACRMLQDFPSLHDTYVEKPRLAFRDMAKAVRCEVEEAVIRHNFAPRESSLNESVASLEHHIEDLKETFMRRAFATSNAIIGMACTVSDLNEEERSLVETLDTLLKRWESIRIHKIDATNTLHQAVQERISMFNDHHEAVASSTLTLLANKARLEALASSFEVGTETLASLDRQQQAEEAAHMELQRFVFELQTRAHECHHEAFRQVCLATEELACRKEQAHKVICDRLDRCTAELEIAMDSLEESSRGIAREKNELERVARELHRDVNAIRAVGISSSGVFEDRTAPFLVTCGRASENPMLEAKRLSAERVQKVLAIAQSREAR